eukprot:comp20796_c0_seq1/m.42942 comp20796_c0_seq1/g.42942  ORF comp20796_c0_seq1/g.42942 comp20796_c0_seq1/m.42942 type:complete len:485 (+) comp20796_c0_seq1:127-1581(+)
MHKTTDKDDKKKTAETAFINNHLVFNILYHTEKKSDGSEANYVVGFEVEPMSIKHVFSGPWKNETASQLKSPKVDKELKYTFQTVEQGEEIVYTYDVNWEPSPIKWALRWDPYLKMQDIKIHWMSIINSLLTIFSLTGMIALILVRVLRRDFARYNNLETAEEAQEETGWKLVHGDVFRTPKHYGMLGVAVGVSTQLNAMCIVTIIFAALGVLSPANRGSLMTAMLYSFDFMSIFAGYYSAKLYKLFKGQSWRTNTVRTAVIFPAFVFVVFLFMNELIRRQGSSGQVPTLVLVNLMVLWFGLGLPAVFLGSFFGYKEEEYPLPVKTNQIPRQIPEQAWYMHPVLVCLVGGVLPFGAVLIELYFILSSMWQGQTYYLFGCLLLVYIILLVTCAEITIVFVYFQLCGEDYRWWWRSFLTPATSALYLFLYSLHYLQKLEFDKLVDKVLYVSYMLLISSGFALITGGIGFFAAFKFVRVIYGSIKVD